MNERVLEIFPKIMSLITRKDGHWYNLCSYRLPPSLESIRERGKPPNGSVSWLLHLVTRNRSPKSHNESTRKFRTTSTRTASPSLHRRESRPNFWNGARRLARVVQYLFRFLASVRNVTRLPTMPFSHTKSTRAIYIWIFRRSRKHPSRRISLSPVDSAMSSFAASIRLWFTETPAPKTVQHIDRKPSVYVRKRVRKS